MDKNYDDYAYRNLGKWLTFTQNLQDNFKTDSQKKETEGN